VTPLYPQKLALTSPTGGGRSVGMVRSRTKATEFSLVYTSRRQPGRPSIFGSQRAFTDIKPVVNFWNALFIRELSS